MKSKDVDEYIANADPTRREALQAVRTLIHETIPDVKETMRYNMPTFETTDIICALASQQQYMSLYTCEPSIMEKYKAEMAHLNNGKGCIRFRKLEQLPLPVIKKILKEMVKNPGFSHGKA